MSKLLFLLIFCAIICACTKSDNQEQTENTTQEGFVRDTVVVETGVVDVIEEVEQPTVVKSQPS